LTPLVSLCSRADHGGNDFGRPEFAGGELSGDVVYTYGFISSSYIIWWIWFAL
jgi:hypothetical protein